MRVPTGIRITGNCQTSCSKPAGLGRRCAQCVGLAQPIQTFARQIAGDTLMRSMASRVQPSATTRLIASISFARRVARAARLPMAAHPESAPTDNCANRLARRPSARARIQPSEHARSAAPVGAETADRQPRTRERMPIQKLRGDAQLAADRAHFVFVKRRQRLDEAARFDQL